MGVSFYFANQRTNYEQVIKTKTLWTCPRPNNAPLKESRRLIKDLRRGDVVFHYKDGALRAVSTVVEEWTDFLRPPEYPARPDEKDDGWLVRVEPLKEGLKISYKDLGRTITLGDGGPLKKDGSGAAQKYLSSMSSEDGHRLMKVLGLDTAGTDGSWLGRPPSFWEGDDSDVVAFRKMRAEQRELRQHLVAGRTAACCALCGKFLTIDLLIAAHIKPRSHCNEAERRDFQAVAMLVCNLGCDALFEWGYIAVNDRGNIITGRPTATPHTVQAVALLQGLPCSAYNSTTAPHFAAHFTIALQREESPSHTVCSSTLNNAPFHSLREVAW